SDSPGPPWRCCAGVEENMVSECWILDRDLARLKRQCSIFSIIQVAYTYFWNEHSQYAIRLLKVRLFGLQIHHADIDLGVFSFSYQILNASAVQQHTIHTPFYP
ncbi:hypothetical protein CEXT_784081, partial [Caerostris extrusa]